MAEEEAPAPGDRASGPAENDGEQPSYAPLPRRKPQIVAERKRRTRELPPPGDLSLHDWAKPYTSIECYISRRALNKIMDHCADYAQHHLEAMGFLVGDLCRWKNRDYIVVKDVVTSELDTTAVSVKFRRDAFERLFQELDSITYDYILVGWYHSHPGHSCFLSSTDISTQRRMFNKPFHTAVVVDPLSHELKAYRLTERSYEERMFAIYEDEEESPAFPEALEQVEAAAVPQTAGDAPGVPASEEAAPPQPTEGRPAGVPVEVQAIPIPSPVVSHPKTRRRRERAPTLLILLLPILFTVFGGVVGYLWARRYPGRFRALVLVTGLLMAAVWALLGPPLNEILGRLLGGR